MSVGVNVLPMFFKLGLGFLEAVAMILAVTLINLLYEEYRVCRLQLLGCWSLSRSLPLLL
jgi:hypothetical protein